MIDLNNKFIALKKALYIFPKGKSKASSCLIVVPTARQSLMLVKGMSAMTIIACVIQLFLGANAVVVIIAGLTFLLSLYPIAIFGFLNMGAVLTALLGFRYTGFPIFAKLVFGQALDTHLYTPMSSFGVTFLGFLGYFIAFRLAEYFSRGKPLLRSSSSHHFLGRVSVLAAIIGISANLMVAFQIDEQDIGATVANFFISFIFLAIISGIARIIIKTKGRQSIDAWILFLFAVQIEFAMVLNSRMAIMEVFLCWIATSISFEAKLRWRHLIITVVAIVLMNTFITPVFLYLRDFRSDLSWTQRTSVAIDTATHWQDAVEHHMDWKELSARQGWYRNYYDTPQTVLERMSHINNVDMLKNGADINGYVGIEDILLSLKRAMPRFLSPDKPIGYSQGSWIYWRIGIPNAGPYPNAPLIGTGYVAFGWIGAFFYPFLFGLGWFIFTKKISGFDLGRNIWSIYFFLRLHNGFVEGSSDAYLANLLRILPQDFILLWMVSFLASGRFLYPYRKKRIQAYANYNTP